MTAERSNEYVMAPMIRGGFTAFYIDQVYAAGKYSHFDFAWANMKTWRPIVVSIICWLIRYLANRND